MAQYGKISTYIKQHHVHIDSLIAYFILNYVLNGQFREKKSKILITETFDVML